MNKLTGSRGPNIDIDRCAANVGNRFDLVLIAATRTREIKRQNAVSKRLEGVYAPVTSLLEIQDGKVGREYLEVYKQSKRRRYDQLD